MNPLHELEISATEGRHFYKVFLFASKLDMLAWARKNHPRAPEDFDALTCSAHPTTPCRKGNLGLLVFSAESFAPSIIQHELLHVAFSYERRVYGNTNSVFATPESEERLAYTQQNLLDDLLFKLEEAGLQEFGIVIDEPEQVPERKPMILDDSNSTLSPDGGRLYPKLKPGQAERNAKIQAETRARMSA